MTAALAITENVLEVPLDDVLPSTIPNYRRSFNEAKLRELADSMRQAGVLEPIVLRPNAAGALELVFGERRLRAARLAQLPTIKAIVRPYNDEQVRESRLIENAMREDADPLDESEAFAELTKLGYTVAGIAEKIGQSQAYVAQRLPLTQLSVPCRAALAEGKISIGVAVVLAALPSAKLQEQGLEEVMPEYDNRIMTVADARREIEDSVMMQLGDAPFQTDDAELVPAAGACTNCPKRTGAQALLFADASSPDLCTDRLCYRSKQDADWKARQKTLKAEGVSVLGVKEGAEAINRLNYGDSKFVRLDSEHWDGKRHVKVSKVVGKKPETLTLARDPKSGLVVELVPAKVFQAAAKAAKPDTSERSTPDAKAKKEREAERVKAEANRRAMAAIVEAVDERARQGKPPRALLRLAVRGALDSVWTDVTKKVADRRGLPLTDEGQGTTKKGAKRKLEVLAPAKRIERLLDSLDEGGLFALLLELAMGRSVPGKWSEGSDCYVDLCGELGVNPKGIEANLKAELKARTDGKSKSPPKARSGVMHLIGKGGRPACGQPVGTSTGSGATTTAESVTCPGCLKAAAVQSAEATTRPVHPATGLAVHYIDTSGLSPTGVVCGGKVGGKRGTVTEEAAKVTCKSCRRMAGIEATEPSQEEA